MKKSDKKTLLAQPIGNLGLRRKAVVDLLIAHLHHTRPDLVSADDWYMVIGCRDCLLLDPMAGKVTVGEAITAWDSLESRTGSWRSPVGVRGVTIKQFLARLEELGFTRLDWIRLPQRTIQGITMSLSGLTKEEILDKKILVLGTDSYKRFKWVERVLKIKVEDIAVRKLLTLESSFGKYYKDTVHKLRLLGFNRNDGSFIPATEAEAKEDLIQHLCRVHKLTTKQSKLVVTIAKKETWIN